MAFRLLLNQAITSLEIVVWLLFFSLLALAYVLGSPLMENTLLVVGVGIGLFSLYKMSRLAANYQQNAKEIKAWTYRFCVFKVLPVGVAFIVAAG